MLDWIAEFGLAEATAFFGIVNVLTLGASIALRVGLRRTLAGRALSSSDEAYRRSDVGLALVATLVNTGISIAGWQAWRVGWIDVSSAGTLGALGDFFAMVVFMDFSMYVTHRIAHHPWLYALFHARHHRHVATNAISLFVLHPLEVVGFGGLMLSFLVLYEMSFAGLLAYLVANVVFGTIGHAGVEIMPRRWRADPVRGLVALSAFHAGHHERPESNYGFYTSLWDRLAGTVDLELRAQGARSSGAKTAPLDRFEPGRRCERAPSPPAGPGP